MQIMKRRESARWRFGVHYLQMLVAMFAGMFFLAPLWDVDRPDLDALAMGVNMTASMVAWMWFRGHRWTPIVEMSAAMLVPTFVLLLPYWAGILDGEALVMGTHMLMLPAMLVVMLLRRDEYTRHHEPADAHGLEAAIRRRWPTWLALGMTIGNVIEPGVVDAWIMLVLPTAYLVIGGWRRTLNTPGILAVQVAGFAGYLVLILVAVSVDDDLARYLIAAGWLLHGVWDLVHHRLGKVVPKSYAEWCGVVDTVIGLSILFLL